MASLLLSLSILAKHTHDKRKQRKKLARAEFNDARFAELQRETDAAARLGLGGCPELEPESELEEEEGRGYQGQGKGERRLSGTTSGTTVMVDENKDEGVGEREREGGRNERGGGG